MKKYITAAALLAAGTMLANAAVLDWTLTGDDVYTSGTKIRTASEGTEFSLALTFTINAAPTTDNTVLAQIQQWDSGSSYVYAKSNGGVRVEKTGGGGDDGYNVNTNFVGEKVSVVFTWAYGDDGKPTISTYVAGTKRYDLTSTSTASDLNLIVTQNDSLWTLHDVSAYSSVLTADDISYLNTNKTSVVPSIPEPSAFGLLAGIGALALVASSRRRKA